MAIYELTAHEMQALPVSDFASLGVTERGDIQRILRQRIEIVSPDTLIIAEEFSDWDASRRRIDLLGIDSDGNIVVIELKRTVDGGFMDLQSIRYASMIANLQFSQAVAAYAHYLKNIGDDETDAEQDILAHLGWEEVDERKFGNKVRIVLVASDFGQELTTSVLWLNDIGLDIRCVRLEPYRDGDRIIVDVQQLIPLPEASEYQIKVAGKKQKERIASASSRDLTRYDIILGNQTQKNLPKRHAIFQVFAFLAKQGVSPSSIADHCGKRKQAVLLGADGTLDEDAFETAISALRSQGGKPFERHRYFCKDGQLIHYQDKTYALTNQWGGSDWEEAMTALCNTYCEHRISYAPSK